MSYLLLPVLYENGLFTEALKQNQMICNFHLVAKRETLDMIGLTFKYSNYNKGLELQRFLKKCEK